MYFNTNNQLNFLTDAYITTSKYYILDALYFFLNYCDAFVKANSTFEESYTTLIYCRIFRGIYKLNSFLFYSCHR